MTKIWQCKIGEVEGTTAPSDPFMRAAVEQAYVELTGTQPKFTFSGWGATLTEGERAVVENRLPVEEPAPIGAPRTRTPCEHCGAANMRGARDVTAMSAIIICDGCEAFVGPFVDDEGSRP